MFKILGILTDIVVFILCIAATQIRVVRTPALLLLISTMLSLIIDLELFLFRLNKVGTPFLKEYWHTTVLITINPYLELYGRVSGLAAFSWLLVIVFSRNANSFKS